MAILPTSHPSNRTHCYPLLTTIVTIATYLEHMYATVFSIRQEAGHGRSAINQHTRGRTGPLVLWDLRHSLHRCSQHRRTIAMNANKEHTIDGNKILTRDKASVFQAGSANGRTLIALKSEHVRVSAPNEAANSLVRSSVVLPERAAFFVNCDLGQFSSINQKRDMVLSQLDSHHVAPQVKVRRCSGSSCHGIHQCKSPQYYQHNNTIQVS